MRKANGLTSLVDVAGPSFLWLGRCEFQYVSHCVVLVVQAGFVENHGHVYLKLDRADIVLGEGFSIKSGSIQVGLELASNVGTVQVLWVLICWSHVMIIGSMDRRRWIFG